MFSKLLKNNPIAKDTSITNRNEIIDDTTEGQCECKHDGCGFSRGGGGIPCYVLKCDNKHAYLGRQTPLLQRVVGS